MLFICSKNYAIRSLFKLFTSPKFQKIRDREKALLHQIENKIEIDDLVISYHQSRREAGPYVLLLHGWEGNAGSMGAFVNPLIEEGYKVIAPNAPAHYTSSGIQCTIRDYQRTIMALIQKFNIRIIISHSFGSAAAILAAREVDRQQIQQIVTISAPNKLKDVVSNFTRLIKLTPSQEQSFFEFVEQKLNLPFKEAELSKILSELNVPALIIHDQNDQLVSVENAHRVAQAHDNTTLYITKGQGHYRILWNEEILETSIKFLQGELENQTYQ